MPGSIAKVLTLYSPYGPYLPPFLNPGLVLIHGPGMVRQGTDLIMVFTRCPHDDLWSSSTSLKLKVYLIFLCLSGNSIHIFSLGTLFLFSWNDKQGSRGEEAIPHLNSTFSPSGYSVFRHSKLREMPLSA